MRGARHFKRLDLLAMAMDRNCLDPVAADLDSTFPAGLAISGRRIAGLDGGPASPAQAGTPS
jgi:hypothetical protein